jgi:hypothetical protein
VSGAVQPAAVARSSAGSATRVRASSEQRLPGHELDDRALVDHDRAPQHHAVEERQQIEAVYRRDDTGGRKTSTDP